MRYIFRVAKCDHNIEYFLAMMKMEIDGSLLFFGVSYNFVAQKWRILAIFHKKINFWEITLKVLGFKTMFKS